MYIAAIGDIDAQAAVCLETACKRAQLTLVMAPGVENFVQAQVAARGVPLCLFVPPQQDFHPIIDAIREASELFAVPVIAMVDHPSENAFHSALAAGANDAVIAGDVNGVLRRVASIAASPAQQRPAKHNGLAIIASTDVPRRRQLGRTLRQAGFDITFASGPDELDRMSSGAVAPKLVVTTPSFAPQGIAAMRPLGAGASRIETVILGEDDRHELYGDTTGDTTGELLFRAEEALRGNVQDRRASRRLHLATVCGFRKAGELQPTFGLTHNVSAGGLYLRTLDVPAMAAEMWLELRLPFTGQTVHLRAEVVSVTAPGSGTARPPGFGVKLLPELCPPADLSAFLSAYTELAGRSPALQN